MLKYNRSTTLSASLIALSLLLSSCGGGSSGGVSIAETDEGANTDASTDGNSNTDTTAQPGITQTEPVSIDVSDASIVTQASKAATGVVARTSRGFDFPSVSTQGGGISMVIPGGPLPRFPARRTLSNGTGQTIEFGDAVTLKYDMFAWSDGSLVESSTSFEEAHTVRGGVSDDFPIPEYLAKSLLGRKLGDIVQVVLPVGTPDLPIYLDQTDAYVLLVELL
jgi:hypothetical protein